MQPCLIIVGFVVSVLMLWLQARACIKEGARLERRRLATMPINEAKDELMTEWARLQAEEEDW